MKKILVPTDFSLQAENALKVAAQLAKKHKSEIYLLHMLELPLNLVDPSNSGGDLPESLYFMKLARKRFEEVLSADYLKGIVVYETVLFQEAFDGIMDAAAKHKVDLVVMGSHGASGFKEMFIGSNTEKVVRSSNIPVLVIKDEHKKFVVKNFVFATDFSNEAKVPFKEAIIFANKMGAKIHLLFVNTASNFLTSAEAHGVMNKFIKGIELENYSLNIYNDTSVEKGILNFAQFIDADLIGMATHGRKGLSHFFNGSISEDLVNHSKRPVITFKI
ncbi:MAG: universal stress protein UspA [Flavobacteriaceae bacterium CG_4_8_14_3_um_filter_34_10]|nr:universal stress protein [Flavobacteriia bacterium]OIP49725.1 MAG: universal stress protein UspA [Flavobacteriaceae bacterium CG2_30_34_30]PIQ19289.1 MAG: universal stress protein UspA [Flavobacteriaceae bacterium CG18_big_fil_WC_8_21_14_2_50_34_36]PIV48515.1 MAG: universal stress protein UspA [Flavobacteriaceae bacterium CG02_land_8_20_14_3_00_34_13]PIX08685.1 MAG: universal stress protein UspA [Flavobacteriaceae bacterium CG_4_8_14_3_um_filter_34_10]PIZ07534.1 MAG: universal stress protei